MARGRTFPATPSTQKAWSACSFTVACLGRPHASSTWVTRASPPQPNWPASASTSGRWMHGRSTFTHPRIRRCRSIAGALPFADATFDVVVSLSAAADVTLLDESANAAVVREVSRVIKPGGHFIMTIEGRGPAANPVALASTLAPLRVTETLRASRALNVWSVDTPVIPGGDDAQQRDVKDVGRRRTRTLNPDS